MKALPNPLMKPSLLQRHLQTNQPEKKDIDPSYFKRLGKSAKKQRLDNSEKQYQQSFTFVFFIIEVYAS